LWIIRASYCCAFHSL